MSSFPKVSVIVPIYNVEKYLRQCLDSILKQTLQDIEIILVDDGSTDTCPSIVDEYATMDSRVIAVHQPNGGYGKAVNQGISLAKGAYIGIIESDDWIEPSMYEKLYKAALDNGADVAKCGFYEYDSTRPKHLQDKPWLHKNQDLFKAPDFGFNPLEWPLIFCFHASLWTNLYRAEFLKKIFFIESKSAAYQDFPFIMEVLAKAKIMTVVKEYLVHYRMEAGQNSSTMRRDNRLLQMPSMSIAARDVLERYNVLDKVKEMFFIHAYLTNIGFFLNIKAKYKKDYFMALRELFLPLADDPEFHFSYFSPKQKKMVMDIIRNKQVRIIYFHNRWKRIRRRLWRVQIRKDTIMISLLGWEKTFQRH